LILFVSFGSCLIRLPRSSRFFILNKAPFCFESTGIWLIGRPLYRCQKGDHTYALSGGGGATRPLPDGGVEKLHGDPTVGPRSKVWTRGQKWKKWCRRWRAGGARMRDSQGGFLWLPRRFAVNCLDFAATVTSLFCPLTALSRPGGYITLANVVMDVCSGTRPPWTTH